MKIKIFSLFFMISAISFSQNFDGFPKIEKEKLIRDLDLLYQGLDKFHSGMYWYTPKDSVDLAFKEARNQLNCDLNVLEFHKIIAPLVGLSREDHTDIFLPKGVTDIINNNEEIRFLPLTVVFLGKQLYCIMNASDDNYNFENLEIEAINGESPTEIATKIGSLFASDGFIKPVKYSDLSGFNFSKYYYYYYGTTDQFQIKFKDNPNIISIKALSINQINSNLSKQNNKSEAVTLNDPLVFKIINSKTALINITTFSNADIKKGSKCKTLKKFLQNSFADIQMLGIENLIIDISQNGGGSEGNEGLLYSYFGDNYQKYLKVRAKTQKAILDNGIDKPIKLKSFGFFERIFHNKKQPDGSYERRHHAGHGLMAYKKAPKDKFEGKVYIIISPTTYSGGSEFSNMMYSNGLATFVGQETGGGYLGNTSGYSQRLILPHSKISIDIPVLQFVMNVLPKMPFGRGVIPHHEVIPGIDAFNKGENVPLKYILEQLEQ